LREKKKSLNYNEGEKRLTNTYFSATKLIIIGINGFHLLIGVLFIFLFHLSSTKSRSDFKFYFYLSWVFFFFSNWLNGDLFYQKHVFKVSMVGVSKKNRLNRENRKKITKKNRINQLKITKNFWFGSVSVSKVWNQLNQTEPNRFNQPALKKKQV
jgi:hypothetical protein